MTEYTSFQGDQVPVRPGKRGGVRWSNLTAEIEAESGPITADSPSRPRAVVSWPRTGTVGATPTMDVDAAPEPPCEVCDHGEPCQLVSTARSLGITLDEVHALYARIAAAKVTPEPQTVQSPAEIETPDRWGPPCGHCGATMCGLDCLEFNAARLPVRGWLGRAIRRIR